MPPKVAGKDGPPDWWDPQWAPRNVEYKLTVVATFHPSAGTTSFSMPWLDAAGQLTAAPVTAGPFSTFDVDEAAACPKHRFPGAVTARTEKSLGSLATSYQFIQGLQRACLRISFQLGNGEADAKAAGAAQLHPGPLLLANDGEDSELPDRPSEVFASLTETLGLAGVYKVEVKLSTDIPVLSPEMLRRLMPACFTVDVIRSLPNELWLSTDCEDVHVEVYPQTGSINTRPIAEEYHRSKSMKRPHNAFVKFATPTVWLLGAHPGGVDGDEWVHAVREWMQSEALVVELHDRDLRRTEEVPEITDSMDDKARAAAERKRKRIEDLVYPHGLARFKLSSLLVSKNLKVQLRADVFPNRGNNKKIRAETALELKAAELVGDQGREIIADASSIGKTEQAPEYLSSGTVCAIWATLAVPIPHAHKVQAKTEEREAEEWISLEQREGESNIWSHSPKADQADTKKAAKRSDTRKSLAAAPVSEAIVAPTRRCRAKVPTGDEDESMILGPWRATREEAEEDEEHLRSMHEESAGDTEKVQKAAEALRGKNSLGVDRRFERYGRVVIISDDNDTKTNKAVLDCVRLLNAKTLGINPDGAEMLSRTFHDDERANPHLDVLTGFSVIDGKCRLMVIEGLREHGLKRLLEAVPREAQPNHAGFKMLHNPEIGFSEREYWDFGAKVYQLKIRTTLERLAAKPDLYVVMPTIHADTVAGMKVPETLMQIKQMERLQPLREGTTFPKASHVEQLNVLFGDYLSDGMMEGNSVADEHAKDAAFMSQTKKYKRTQQLTQNFSQSDGALAAKLKTGRTELPRSTLTHSVTKRNIMEKTGTAVEWPQGNNTMKTQVLRDLPIALPAPPPAREQLDHWNKSYKDTVKLRQTSSAPDLMNRNKDRVKERSDANVHLNHILNKRQPRQTPFLDGEEVFMYSGQKLNCVEKQKAWMREKMATEAEHTMYSYAPAYGSQTFELTAEGAESGKRTHQARCPTDTYARTVGDGREVWRATPARPKEDFRKPAKDIGAARGDELHEGFVEGEWHKFTPGEHRHKPKSVENRYEPDKIPHHRQIVERPFDSSLIVVKGVDFGPKSMNESVHYNAHGAPGDDRHADVKGKNVTEFDEHKNRLLSTHFIKTFSQGETRRGVTCMDREELLLKDAPSRILRGSGLDDKLPTTIRTFEPYQGFGNPAVEFQARMRENDTSAPFDVSTGGYIKRDPNVGMKCAVQSGTLARAPWRHEAPQQPAKPKHFSYVSQNDFNATRMPGKTLHTESHVWKNASRTMLGASEKSSAPFLRPKDYGVSIPTNVKFQSDY